jgi:small subunit ribosomal protein S14
LDERVIRLEGQVSVIPHRADAFRFQAQMKLNKLPRNASPVRVRNRCEISGRPRAFYRKFRISRIALRDLAAIGQIPGVVKSSW